MRLEITGLNHQGEGVGRLEGKVYFVPGALPGELVDMEVIEEKKSWARGRLQAILAPSPNRCQPGCKHYFACGGCQLQHLDYTAQLAAKRELVQSTLVRIGKQDPARLEVRPVLGMQQPWHYRNKAVWQVTGAPGRVRLGFFQQGGQRIVPVRACSLLLPGLNELKQKIEDLINEEGLIPYDWRKHSGQLRHVILRQTRAGQTMVGLVTAGENNLGSRLQRIAAGLQAAGVTTVVWNLNPGRSREILGRTSRVLAGPGYIVEELLGLQFRVALPTFMQVNPEQTQVLYQEALRAAELSGLEQVIDAYCGVGTISLLLARQAAAVRGVEVVVDAITAARINAELNGITNASFSTGLAEQVLPTWQREGFRADVIVVDPPRAGVELPALTALAGMEPERIVYVSCDVATLARDLARLQELGYYPLWIQPVDMFPQTGHVECVTLMSKVEK